MFIPLSKLLTADRDGDTPVAQTPSGVKTFANLCDETADLSSRIKERELTEVVLATTSSYAFATGFLAALQADCRIIIPPNALPGMLAHFVEEDCPLLYLESKVDTLRDELQGHLVSGFGWFRCQKLQHKHERRSDSNNTHLLRGYQ